MKKLIAIVSVFLIFYILLGSLKIEKIVCESQSGDCSLSIMDELRRFEGEKVRIAIKRAEKALENNVLVNDYRVRFVPLSTLKVILVEEKAEYALKNSSEDFYTLVDINGKILQKVEETRVEIINYDKKIPDVGGSMGGGQFALKLAKGVSRYYQVKSKTLDDNFFLIELTSGTRILFPLEGDTELLLGAMNLIVTKISNVPEFTDIVEIDLRYKNPILRKNG